MLRNGAVFSFWLTVLESAKKAVPNGEILAEIAIEFGMMQIMVGHDCKVFEKPVISLLFADDLVAAMPGGVEDAVKNEVGHKCQRMHWYQENQYDKETKLDYGFCRLK